MSSSNSTSVSTFSGSQQSSQQHQQQHLQQQMTSSSLTTVSNSASSVAGLNQNQTSNNSSGQLLFNPSSPNSNSIPFDDIDMFSGVWDSFGAEDGPSNSGDLQGQLSSTSITNNQSSQNGPGSVGGFLEHYGNSTGSNTDSPMTGVSAQLLTCSPSPNNNDDKLRNLLTGGNGGGQQHQQMNMSSHGGGGHQQQPGHATAVRLNSLNSNSNSSSDIILRELLDNEDINESMGSGGNNVPGDLPNLVSQQQTTTLSGLRPAGAGNFGSGGHQQMMVDGQQLPLASKSSVGGSQLLQNNANQLKTGGNNNMLRMLLNDDEMMKPGSGGASSAASGPAVGPNLVRKTDPMLDGSVYPIKHEDPNNNLPGIFLINIS